MRSGTNHGERDELFAVAELMESWSALVFEFLETASFEAAAV